MWETLTTTSYRGNSLRRIFSIVAAGLVAALLWVLLTSFPAHAADVSWRGNDIFAQGKTFTGPRTSTGSNPDVPNGAQYYRNAGSADLGGNSTVDVIYFDNGSDPKKASTAKYVVYTVDGSGNWRDKRDERTLSASDATSSNTTANWSGGSITYDGNQYSNPKTSSGTNPDIPNGAKYYANIGSADLAGNVTARYIYFPQGTDPASARDARYVVYTVDGNGNWRDKRDERTISISGQSTDGGGATAGDAASKCSINGVGWIICPVTNFLAWGMDNIFNMLQGFLQVQPLTTQRQSLYTAWEIARNFANVAFVIGFLIIIFSQLTSMGVSNYGIKKLLPRLIVAAILVNVSYWICAVAIDISNILGSSLQDLFIWIRDQAAGSNPSKLNSWASISGFILAGGTAAAATAAGIVGLVITTGGSLGAAIILLLPMLLILILAILVALAILAARQALITLLVIVSPLAFVAYILPNTEKWFEKWRASLLTMLVFFPIFSVLFGGSQLAGRLIIDNTDQLNIVLLGMFVQVAPLVITPLIIRFSGKLLGQIAGMINNPNKGLIDRSRKLAQSSAEHLAHRNMARRDPVRRTQMFRRMALGADSFRRTQDARRKQYDLESDARWTNSQEYSDIEMATRVAQDRKQIGETIVQNRYDQAKNVAGVVRGLDVDLRELKARADTIKLEGDINWENNQRPDLQQVKLQQRVMADSLSSVKSREDAMYQEFQAGDAGAYVGTAGVLAMLRQSQQDMRDISLNGMRKKAAESEQQLRMADILEQNTQRINGQTVRDYAGGIQGIAGAQRALASAVSTVAAASDESLKNASAILAHGNYTDGAITDLALGNSGTTGIIVTNDIRRAAIRKIAGGGNTDEILRLATNIEINATPGNQEFRQELGETLLANSNKPKFIGAGTIANIKQGNIASPGQARIDSWIIDTINAGKLSSAQTLSTQDRTYIEAVADTINRNRAAVNPQVGAELKDAISMAFSDNRYSGQIAERAPGLRDMFNNL